MTQKQAASRAIDALGSDAGGGAVIVFGLPKPLKAGTKITQAGTTKPGRGSTKGLSSKLRSAGVRTVKAPKVLSVRTRSYFFYEDRGPFMLYQHPGRVALVDVATGKVTLSRTITWPPLINGRLPAFLKSAAAYRSSKYRALYQAWTLPNAVQQPRTSNRNVFDQDPFGPGRPLPSLANFKTIANRLAAEGSCVLRVTDTLPSFWNANELNLTRSYVGTLFEQLERDNPAFVDDRYGARTGESLGDSIDRLVAAGCKDILLYIAGQGYSSAGEPVIHLGTSVRPGGLIAQQNISATDLRNLVSARPAVTFKFKFDAPYSGGMVDRLRDLANVLLIETPAATGDEAFAFIPEVENSSGEMVTSTSNPAGLLEFTNCELIGLKAFFDSQTEIDKATQGQNEGVSFLAEMLARSQELCNGDGGFADDMGAAPQLYAQKRASGAGTNRPPKADKQEVTVVEDTPTNITLTGSDPDGDPLTFSITKAPDHGDLSGTPPNVTYTPDADYVGPDDFSFKVDDGKGASNTAKVDITVVEGNDPPVVTTSAGSTAYTEGGAAVVVDGGVTVSDEDDTQLEGAIVRVHEDDFQSNDVLEFTPQLGITGFYDTGTGSLFLSGTASVSDYQTALRDVRFSTANDNPKTPKRILFSADDGDGPGAAAIKNLAITGVDDPPQVDASDFNLGYTENDGPVPADQFVGVFDPDSDNITGATIDAADATWIPAQDQLAWSDNDAGDGITFGAYNDSTGTLTLTGTGTAGQYQAAIQAVTYENNSENPNTTNRTISFQVADGALNSNTDSRQIEITPVNDAPVLANGGTMNYTENGAAAPISSTITTSDVDDTQLEGATITITTGAENSTDDLSWSDNNGADSITLDTDDNSTDTLTLVGTGTLAEYQAAIRAVSFSSSSDNPATSKTVAFTVTDGDVNSAPENATVNITRVNDHSVLDTTDAALAYTEGTGAQAVDNGITVTDVDSANLVGATIQISGNHVQAQDDLSFPDNNTGDGITLGSYNDSTGTLTLTGTGTLAEYQAALRAVAYTNIADNPSTSTRTVSFQVDDGGAVDNLSNVATRDINITPVNDAPSVSNAGTLNYTENDPATQISNTLTVSDPDDTNLESASAELTGNAESGDQLGWVDNNGADSIVLDGGNTTATKIALTGTGTLAEYQAALRAITFTSTNNHPATSKTVTYIVNDGDVSSGGHTATINVTRVNDKPVVNMTDTALTYAEGSGDQQIDGNVTITDPESDQMSGATVDAADATWVPAEDQLTFTDTDTGDGITLGSYNDTTGTLTLTGTASLAAYEAALEDVKYSSNSNNPSGSRTISMTVTDVPGATSDPDSRTINFTTSNDAPVVANAGTLNYTENDPATQISNTLTVSDDDDTNIESASAELTGNAETGDLLGWVDNNGADSIVLDGSSTATKIVLTGTGTLAQYEAALRAITFTSTNNHPATSKTVTYIANDGDANSAGHTATINVTRVNDKPVVNMTDTALTYTEDSGDQQIDGNVTLTDAESDQISGATIDAADATWVPADDQLTFSDTDTGDGITLGSYNDSTGTLTLTGTASLAAYEAALEDVKYSNNSNTPSGSRTISMTVTDLPGATSDPDSRTINITASNDAPVLDNGGGPVSYTEGGSATQITNTLTVADADDTNLESATAEITANAQTGDLLEWTDNNGADSIVLDGSSTATKIVLTGTGTLAQYEAALRAVTFRTTNDNPAASKTVSFIGNDGDANSAAEDVTISITPVNDPPVADLNGTGTGGINTTATFTEPVIDGSGNPVTLAPNADALDSDDTTLDSAKVTLTNRPDSPAEALSATGTASITVGAYNPTTGELDLTTPSGEAPLSEWSTVLRSITYDNTAATPTDTDRTVTVTLNDGTADSSPASTVTIDIVPQNVAPTLDLNGAAAGEDVNAAFTEGSGAVTLAPNADVADADDTTLASATVTITNLQDGAAESLTANVGATGITANYNSGTGVLTLTKSSPEASVADYQQVLRTVAYNNTSDTPNTTSRAITFKVNDGQIDSATRTANTSVDDTNDPPVNTVGGPVAMNEDGTHTLVTGDLQFADPDATSLEITMTATNGTMSISDTSGLTLTTGDGTDDATLVFTGTIATINSKITAGHFSFKPTANHFGSASIQITSDDNGATGGADQTDTDTLNFNVASVNDPPNITPVPNQLVVDEDVQGTFSPSPQITDVDAGTISVDLTVTNGSLTLGSTTGLTFDPGDDGTDDKVMGFSGSLTDVNNALNGLKYRGDLNYNGDDDILIQVDDGGAAGTDSETVDIDVTPVNDNPVADNESFSGNDSAHGNTTMQVDDPSDDKTAPTHPHTEISGDVLDGDNDNADTPPGTITVVSAGNDAGASDGLTAQGGKVTIEPDGDFVFFPKEGASCTGTSDSFKYKITDGGPAAPTNPDPNLDEIGTVTIAIEGCVWYVHNNHSAATDNLGTAEAPFDTLIQAEAASTGPTTTGTVFVYDGTDTTTGYDTGFTLDANERLIGEHEGLTVDPDGGGGLTADELRAAVPNEHPNLTDTVADVVHLNNGVAVHGFQIDPQGGGGICGGAACGGAASNGSTIDDVKIIDGGTAGTQPGLEMDGTTGTHTVTDLTYDNVTTPNSSAPAAVRLNNGGIVTFAAGDAGDPTKLNKLGGPALVSAGTRLDTSTFDEITVAGSGTGGVNVSGATGANNVAFGDGTGNDLLLTTTSGTDPAFRLSGNAGTWGVPDLGTADISATGGAAVDITNTTGGGYNFDDVDSTNSSNGGGASGDGINLVGLGTTNFVAATGDIKGHTGIAFDLDGGNGTVTYPGGIGDVGAGTNDGTGDAARVQNRSGGAVTLSGSMEDDNDTGGGISMSGNSGGSTAFSGSTMQLNTGSVPGVSITQPNGGTHAVTFSGGTLDIDTAGGNGFSVTGDAAGSPDGTVNVTGNDNTIASGTGRALDVNNAAIGSSDLIFESIASTNSGSNGIRLNNTGGTGGLTVQGDGDVTADGGGGTITNATLDNVLLTNTTDVSLTDMNIHNANDSGISADAVTNMDLDKLVMNANGAQAEGGAIQDAGIHIEDLVGTGHTISDSTVFQSRNTGLDWDPNSSSSMSHLTITGSKFNQAGHADGGPLLAGNSGVSVQATGTANVKLSMSGSEANDNPSFGVQTGAGNGTAVRTDIDNIDVMDTTGPWDTNGGVIHTVTGGNGQGIHRLINSDFNNIGRNNASTIGMSVNGTGTFDGTFTGNDISAPGNPARSGNQTVFGFSGQFDADSDSEVDVQNNTVYHTAFEGMLFTLNDFAAGGNPADVANLDLNVHNNTIGMPDDVLVDPLIDINGIEVQGRHDNDLCLDITGNNAEGRGADPFFSSDILAWKRNATAIFRIERLTPAAATAAQAATHINNENPADEVSADTTGGGTFTGVANGTCQTPSLP